MKLIFKLLPFMFILGLMPKAFALNIVAANYPAFDLIFHVAKDKADISVLLKPGADAHSFEPTPKDIASIEKSDLFFYVGGENDAWIRRLLKSMNNNINTLSMLEHINPLRESLAFEHTLEDHHHHDHDEAFDEHVWTAPKNNIKLLAVIAQKLSMLDPDNSEFYHKNAQEYAERFAKLDRKFQELISSSQRKTIIVADRFPFLYFASDYGLDYYAAFSGCAEDTEASAKTISFLIEKIRELKINYVIKQEFSTLKLADTIASETGSGILTLNACHNISKEQYQNKVEMIELLEKNLITLKKALN